MGGGQTDLRYIRDDEIKWVETTINKRPVRKFSYLSYNRKLKNHLLHLLLEHSYNHYQK